MSSLAMSLALIGARDPGSTHIVYGIVIALAALGVALAFLAWWLARTTRPDPELLAPLEAIESRRWRGLDPAGQRRMLDELRPEGAQPVDPAPAEPSIDDEFGDEPARQDVRELAPEDAAASAEDSAVDPEDSDDPEANGVADDGESVTATGPARSAADWQRWDSELGLDTPEPAEPAETDRD